MNVDGIREQADLASVIGEYVQLRKAGTHRMEGLCPFHTEKTPSFHVDTVKNLFICRSCGAGGDVFTFLQRMDGISFTEAARKLADRFGIQLEPEGKALSPAEIRQERIRREQAKSLMAEAEHWRLMERPPRLMVYDHPPTPQELSGAYTRACTEDSGLRAWIRGDLRQSRDITFAVIDMLAKRQERDSAERIVW